MRHAVHAASPRASRRPRDHPWQRKQFGDRMKMLLFHQAHAASQARLQFLDWARPHGHSPASGAASFVDQPADLDAAARHLRLNPGEDVRQERHGGRRPNAGWRNRSQGTGPKWGKSSPGSRWRCWDRTGRRLLLATCRRRAAGPA
ncbi:hypothetical protein ACFOPN_20310 [Xanthomonas hyacinthi]|uniref:hypothetical protein n=1 Tax=Xanthomonas hyacinthi TaxID=56455 RepID=UPI00361788CE